MDVNIFRVQILGLTSSILMLLIVGGLIRRDMLKVSHSLTWIFMSLMLLIFSIWREALHFVSKILGIAYPPAMLFIVLIFGLMMLIMQLFVIITKLSIAVKRLTQELGLLQLDLRRNNHQEIAGEEENTGEQEAGE